jgi:hypothetical protein
VSGDDDGASFERASVSSVGGFIERHLVSDVLAGGENVLSLRLAVWLSPAAM